MAPSKRTEPRDPLESVTERIVDRRDEHIDIVRRGLAKLSIYAPRILLEQVFDEIRESANTLAWDCEAIGEDYPGLRKTPQRTPPDPDRAPIRGQRAGELTDEDDTLVGSPHGRRRNRK